ncbi:RNA polymerase sigma factor [Flagellimonas hymeniacidonis]|uniref:RNA polymerase sigma factor n=1 Tax=Flagellimonas hymeniacidonis TaxID=2603628 RepID=A0A5C8V5Z6_9FLAO|nr:RNA polymerase sigma factor [Flagellimonas hymeniacidonis]TXN36770.1 RNA polymerase sigma factor [Flagellimonas hymeniacidonis]
MESHKNISDEDLIEMALTGHKKSLEVLIERNQNWIFNVALTFVGDSAEAADLTQEVLIKVITKLDTFKNKSSFRTWMYRIIKNHFLNMKRGKHEVSPPTFEQFGQGLDKLPDESLSNYAYEVEEKLLVQEAKISCMKGMLLCLDREQRLIYIIGELFEFPDSVGSEIMEISKQNFRTKLHRAKKQLYNFMDHKCGLINTSNPCRCHRKTAGFVKMGYVDPVTLNFQRDVISEINAVIDKKVEIYSDEVLPDYQKLYQEHPFLKSPDKLASIRELLATESVKQTFNL